MHWVHTCHALSKLLAAFPLLRMLCLYACELQDLSSVRAATLFEIVLHLPDRGSCVQLVRALKPLPVHWNQQQGEPAQPGGNLPAADELQNSGQSCRRNAFSALL